MPEPPKVEKNPYAISDEEMKQAIGAPEETTPEPSTMQTIGQGAMDLGKGVVKGALSTAQHVGSMIFPNALAAKFGMAPGSDKAFEPHGTMQNIGKGAEQIGEFFLPSGRRLLQN